MSRHVLGNILDDAGRRCVHRQHSALAKRQWLTAQYAIAGRYADLTFMTNMLFQRNNKPVRQRQLGQRRTVRLGFHFRRMNAALKIPGFLFFKKI